MRLAPGADPVELGSGRVGVVLSHGFTGSPVSMRPWAEHLADQGFRVVAPRLPGHGTSWELLNRTSWEDWFAGLERAFLRLSASCDVVVAGGQSMGGCLVLRLAQVYGSHVHGVMLVNPSLRSNDPRLIALPVLRRFVESIAPLGNDIHKPVATEGAYDRTPLHALAALTRLWRVVGAELPAVTQPLLVFRSPQDHIVDASSVRLLRARVGSREIEEHALPDSYHVATLDYDAPTIFAESASFVGRLAERAGVRAEPSREATGGGAGR
ncbi:MAG TPA: alpha/beta fold hydrolase [Actinopolymorphaceae bacterium]